MDVFIRRLPESVTKLDLIHFLSGATRLHWNIFGLKPRTTLVGCEIYKMVNRENNSVEFHGIAHVEPTNVALATIERLNRTPLKGKLMEVRKFFHRATRSDRRRRKSDQRLLPHFIENRKETRRRDSLIIEELHAGATSAEIVIPRIANRHYTSRSAG